MLSSIARSWFLPPLLEELLKSFGFVVRPNLESPIRSRPYLYALGSGNQAGGNPDGPTSAVFEHFCHHGLSHSTNRSIDIVSIHVRNGRFSQLQGCGQMVRTSISIVATVTPVARHHTVPLEGLEPPTLSLGRNCSSIELQRQWQKSTEPVRQLGRDNLPSALEVARFLAPTRTSHRESWEH